MTDKEKIFTILRNLWKEDNELSSEHRICYNRALQDVQIAFDSLPEEPVSNELEEEIDKYTDNPANYLEYSDGWSDLTDIEYIEKCARYFANWQKEQMIDKACEWLKALNNEHQVMSYTDSHILDTDELTGYFKNLKEAEK